MTQKINVFHTQPEWLAQDKRTGRPTSVPNATKPGGPGLSYTITAEFLHDRHRVMLPPELIQDKTILDVGCMMGTTGAWCLANGARHYTGIDSRCADLELGEEIFKKYFNHDQYSLVEGWIETFRPGTKYDIVIASGVIYAVFDSFEFVKTIANLSRDIVLVDAVHPFNGYRRLFPDATDQQRKDVSKVLSIIQPSERIRMNSADKAQSVRITASIVSLQALVLLMKNSGFEYDDSLYHAAETEIGYYYDIIKHNRYMAKFAKSDVAANTYKAALENPNTEVASQWLGNLINK
jgi:hypothetical protein